ncbi:MAG: hypothetical protein WCW77_04330 [Patescibacteria group bacterium]
MTTTRGGFARYKNKGGKQMSKKAFLATDVCGMRTGLNILVIPQESGNSLAVHIADEIWIEEEKGRPGPEKVGLAEINLPVALYVEVICGYKANVLFDHVMARLKELVKKTE